MPLSSSDSKESDYWLFHFILRKTLNALQPKAFTPRTADSTQGLRCTPNRLLDQPKPTQANQVRVSDITYLPLANGAWAYLCAFQDMASKQVVGWQCSTPQKLDRLSGLA